MTTTTATHNTSNATTSSGEVVDVFIPRIVKSKELQPRNGLDATTVKRYTAQMAMGQQFPPVTIHQVGEALYLVDGWHRVAAAEANGYSFTKAVVVQSNIEDARWAAGEANLRHGLPLKNSELRNVFRLFIKARKYRKGRIFMSYAEIGAVIGKGKTTIRNWMLKDFPKIAARMSSEEEGMNMEWNPPAPETQTEMLQRETRELAEQLAVRLAALHGELRLEMIGHVQEMLNEASVEKPFEPPKVEEPDF
jgi:hypothetical protein